MRLIDADDVIKFYLKFITDHGFKSNEVRFSINDIISNLWNIPTVNVHESEKDACKN